MRPMLRTGARRRSVLPVLLLVAVGAACGHGAEVSSPTTGQSAAVSLAAETPTPTQRASGSVAARVPLPSGFPVFPGAVAVAMADDDPGLIGLWSSDRPGSAAYDFYVSALPTAGYPLVGLYPGGDVALIRFRAGGGAIWQMVAHGGTGGTEAIEIRLDRP